MSVDRARLVSFARRSIARGSKSFALASRLFDSATRERVWLLYAWCRACDDLADAQDHGGPLGRLARPEARLATIRMLTELAFAGEDTGNPAFDALGLVARECGLTRAMAEDVIAGFALDAAGWHPRSEADMLRYCFHVAGAVGMMTALVMGVPREDEDTLDRACDLGIAFQLGNIARDLSDDDRAGRCYLPAEWLAEADIPPGEQMKPHYRQALLPLIGRLCALARTYQASARTGARRLPLRSRWAVLAAAGIYGAIAEKVRLRGAHAWDRRVSTSTPAKLGHVCAGLAGSLMPCGKDAPHPVLSRRELSAQKPRQCFPLARVQPQSELAPPP